MEHHEILIIGGGNAGISLAAKLLRDGARDVAIVESESTHRYRPLLNYVGAGEASMNSLERPASAVMPAGATWIHDAVAAVDPENLQLDTVGGRSITCKTLVVCPGLEENWDATPGLAEAYGAGWAGSTFVVQTAPQVWPALNNLREGRVVFSMPAEPAPCAATALKPLFMACDHWRRTGALPHLDVHVVLPRNSPLELPRADSYIEDWLEFYDVKVLRSARVTNLVDRLVTISTPEGDAHVGDVSFAHVIPEYRTAPWITSSGLAVDTDAGLVDVDSFTMQHRRYPAVWALGDVAALETRPSGGALRRQVEILSHNIIKGNSSPLQRYDGYTVMPITVARHKLMLVEVDREGNPQPSIPFPDLVRPRNLTWLVDRYLLPQVYFRRLLRGKV